MSLLESITPHLTACTLREYTPDDLDACLRVYRSNEGEFFPEGAVKHFEDFLEHGTSYLLVVEQEGVVVGCGGLELSGDGPWATMVHGMIHHEHRRRGLGSTLLAARLSLVETEGRPVQIRVRSGTPAAPFFGRFGFELAQVVRDYYGPGVNAGILTLNVTPAEVDGLKAALAAAGVAIVLNELPAEDGGQPDGSPPDSADEPKVPEHERYEAY